ncbi:hypothetical protein PRNP1_009658 [Phytophthora ramorum]
MLRLPWSKLGAIAPTPVASIVPTKTEDIARKFSPIASPEEALELELSPGLFRLAWVLVMCAHMLCGMYLLIFAATYYYLTDPIMGYYVHLWAPKTGNLHYDLYAMTCANMYFLHLGRMLQLVYYSIRECRLSFRRSRKPMVATVDVHTNKAPKGVGTDLKTSVRVRSIVTEYRNHSRICLRPATRAWGALFAQDGLFGVENQHFLTVYIFRELLELSTQTYQAYQFSRFLPRVWLNTLMVSMLLANCWSTLAVQHFLGSKPALERVVALSTDAVICIAMCVIVPCLLIAPYANAMDTANSSFKDPDQLYDPVYITCLVLEFQLTFASSLTDFAAKIIPHLAVFMSLVTIGSLLTRPTKLPSSVAGPTGRCVGKASTSKTLKTPQLSQHNRVHQPTKTTPSALARVASWKRQHSKCSARAHRAVKLVLGLWGVTVMVLHLHAAIHSRLTTVEGCRAFTRPWFSSTSSCVSLVINCYERQTVSADDSAFSTIDESALATVTFAHCPELRIPAAIQHFSNLIVFHIYNSTVVEWGSGSNSISATAHPRLIVTAVGRTNFTSGFPEGLLQPLPASLLSIQFCVTDFTALPDDLPSRWHAMAVVAFEYGALTRIPASLLSLQVFTLSFKGNKLETIPQLAEMPPDLTIPELSLTENPLKELPDKLGSSTTFIVRLDLQDTNLTSLPAWAETQVLKKNYMRGAPYCSTVAPELQPANVQCGPRSVLDLNVDFPLDFIDKIYAINRV